MSSSSSSEEYSESSSSSSEGYSESSSSSYLDYSGEKLIPFIVEYEKYNPVWGFKFDGDIVFAGTGSDGTVIKSYDRFFWEKFYETDDIHATAIVVHDEYLFIGTSPKGLLYRVEIDTISGELYDITLQGGAVEMVVFNDKVFAIGKREVYEFNSLLNSWILNYETPRNVTSAKVISNNLLITVDAKYVMRFDGVNWYKLETI